MINDNDLDDTGIFCDIDVELNHLQELYPNLNNNETSKYYNIETFNNLQKKI